MCPGGKWKDRTWADHKAAMLSAGLNEAGLTKYNLNEGNMCLHFASRLEYRNLWVAQFDGAVKTSGYDFSGIGSPYGWIPHNASFDFLDISGPTLGVFCVFGPVLSSPAHGSISLAMGQIEIEIVFVL
jgi:hypothetical protein